VLYPIIFLAAVYCGSDRKSKNIPAEQYSTLLVYNKTLISTGIWWK